MELNKKRTIKKKPITVAAALVAAIAGFTVVGPVGVAQAATTPEGFIVDFANSDHRLVHVSPGLVDVSPSLLDAGTSPSVAALADGGYEEAFQASDHSLWLASSAEGGHQFRQNCSPNPVPEMPGTSPDITVTAQGQLRVEWAESGRESAAIVTPGVQPQCGFTEGSILPGTTPSVVALNLGRGGYASTWVDSSGRLIVAETDATGQPSDPNVGFSIPAGHTIAPGTIPSIATGRLSDPITTWKLAYQDITGHLVTLDSTGKFDVTPSVLAPHTSPSVSNALGGHFLMSFVASDNSVWVDIDGGGHRLPGLFAAPGSSTAIAAARDGSTDWEVAFERASDHHLVTTDSLQNVIDSTQVMEDGTTPSVAALNPIVPLPGGLWRFDRQPDDNGFAAYAGSLGGGQVGGKVVQITYPVVGTADSSVLFVKAGHTTAECGNPTAVVALREGSGALTAPQLAAIFGTTQPLFLPGVPLFERLCYSGPNPPAQVAVFVSTQDLN
ncbi:hypothetical protein [Kribbella sp. NPDC049584]|uniref:hypothetical protein n=1 Tax=Kribbella sp. NPDC049584 TaxID=3154833 RepID=UPI00344782E9